MCFLSWCAGEVRIPSTGPTWMGSNYRGLTRQFPYQRTFYFPLYFVFHCCNEASDGPLDRSSSPLKVCVKICIKKCNCSWASETILRRKHLKHVRVPALFLSGGRKFETFLRVDSCKGCPRRETVTDRTLILGEASGHFGVIFWSFSGSFFGPLFGHFLDHFWVPFWG